MHELEAQGESYGSKVLELGVQLHDRSEEKGSSRELHRNVVQRESITDHHHHHHHHRTIALEVKTL